MLMPRFNAALKIVSSFVLTLRMVSHLIQHRNHHTTDFLSEVAHSCEPNIAFDLSSCDRSKWHVRAVQNIELGTPREFRCCPLSRGIF
jgi:hypothetical protein